MNGVLAMLEFKNLCKKIETDNDYANYTYHIQGYLLPWLQTERDCGKILKQGNKI